MGCCLSKRRRPAKSQAKSTELSTIHNTINYDEGDPDEEFDDGLGFVPLNAMKDAKIRFDDEDEGDSDDEYETDGQGNKTILTSKVTENYIGNGEGGGGEGGDGTGGGGGVTGHHSSKAFADENLELLKSQLKAKGIVPLEFIPLADIRSEMTELMDKLNKGESIDDGRLDHLLACMELNPEYQKEKEAEAARWRDEIGPFSKECLQTMRAFIPPSIFSCTVDSLVSEHSFSRDLAKRLMTKKCLWLIRINKADIERIHEAELMGRFNPESQGLDIIETAAIYAAIPIKFAKDGTGRKEAWRLSLEKTMKEMWKQHQAKTLLKIKQRSPAYTNQTPQFTQRETLHSMNTVSSSVNERRESFRSISRSGGTENSDRLMANSSAATAAAASSKPTGTTNSSNGGSSSSSNNNAPSPKKADSSSSPAAAATSTTADKSSSSPPPKNIAFAAGLAGALKAKKLSSNSTHSVGAGSASSSEGTETTSSKRIPLSSQEHASSASRL